MAVAAAACLLTGLALQLSGFFDLGTDEDVALTPAQAATLTLLDPERKLPPEARNVRVRLLHWQDTSLFVRFEVPLDKALVFAEDYIALGDHMTSCGSIRMNDVEESIPCRASELREGCRNFIGMIDSDWWLHECPAGSQFGSTRWSEDPPARDIVIVPHGDEAVIYIHTFGT